MTATDTAATPKHAGTANLKPYTKGDPRAIAAGKKSAATRKAKKAANTASSKELAEHLATLTASFSRDQLGPLAAAAAAHTIARVVNREIPVRNGDEAAALVRAFVDIARLEAGEATSHVITARLDPGASLRRLTELQAQARASLEAGDELEAAELEAISPAATAAADAVVVVGESNPSLGAIEAESTAGPGTDNLTAGA